MYNIYADHEELLMALGTQICTPMCFPIVFCIVPGSSLVSDMSAADHEGQTAVGLTMFQSKLYFK